MENSSPPPFSSPSPTLQSPHQQPIRVSEMNILPHVADEFSALWDWGDLLDFTLPDDDVVHIPISLDSSDHPLPKTASPAPDISSESWETEPPNGSDRIRKRDARLTCSNFLAGRIPCACPEMDELMEEEEEGTLQGKKRARTRTVRPASSMIVRCQVQGCEADIRELKGYHRRHRVCLRCANARSVLLDGQSKRYCQQCGKFHILSDFDEGKRSCRRKLERHNNRRRRKPSDSKSPVTSLEKESQVDTPAEDVACDDEAGKEISCLDSQVRESESLLEPEDVHLPTLCSVPVSEITQNDSFVASGDAQVDRGNRNSKYTLSSVYSDNKSAYSSMCPTGRISFKLYDWNPAEFPRRLRHQIFQWLASMPVELEGYIRPGCTILTAFIAMPKFMWVKLYEDPAFHLQGIIVAPQGMLSGKGRIFVYLNDMVFHVEEGSTSITKIEAKVLAPRLHYVEPLCFAAGRPMEFFACGSNLHQTKFRFLISFSGKYLAYDSCIAVPHQEIKRDTDCTLEHQLYKIYIAHTETNFFGPAFIEVENEFGLSNFLPILIGNEGICSEVKGLQQECRFSTGSQLLAAGSLSDACESSLSRQTEISEFILDVAWLLRRPLSDNGSHHWISSQIQRLSFLLSYLLENECIAILARILQYMEILMDDVELKGLLNGSDYADMRLFQTYITRARHKLHKKSQSRGFALDSGNSAKKGDRFPECGSGNDSRLSIPITNQGMEIREDAKLGAVCGSMLLNRTEVVPLLDKQIVMNVIPVEDWPRKSCGRIFSTKVIGAHHLVAVIASAAVCFTMCAVLYHPHEVGEFVVTIRRCLFDGV